MNTIRSMFRLSLSKPLFVGTAVALIAWAGSAQADTIYSIQVQASTIEPGAANFTFQSPTRFSDIPLAASGKYDAAVGTVIGCCHGSYAVSGSATDVHGGTARASASGDGAFAGSTLAQNPLANPPIIFGQAASYTYVTSDFHLAGPSSTTPIPVNLDWKVSASSTGSGSAYADLLIYGGCSSCTAPIFHSNVTNGQDGGLSVIDLLPNEPYRMISTARAADSSVFFSAPFNHGAGSAFVDPLFSLPDAYASTYHFVGLPTPVPEPSVMILLIAGLVAVGFTRAKEEFAGRA